MRRSGGPGASSRPSSGVLARAAIVPLRLPSFDPGGARRVAFLAYRSEAYQVRMYAVFLLGHLSPRSGCSLCFGTSFADSNWRVRGPREALVFLCCRELQAAPVIDSG